MSKLIIKLLCFACVLAFLAPTGCIDSISVDQNGTAIIKPIQASSGSIDVHVDPAVNETPVEPVEAPVVPVVTSTPELEPVIVPEVVGNNTTEPAEEEEGTAPVEATEDNNTVAPVEEEQEIQNDSNSTELNETLEDIIVEEDDVTENVFEDNTTDDVADETINGTGEAEENISE